MKYTKVKMHDQGEDEEDAEEEEDIEEEIDKLNDFLLQLEVVND